MILLTGVFTGCNKNTGADKTKYLGTRVCKTSSDTAQYLIFDENGYWSVFVDYKSLRNGMQQRPELFSYVKYSDNTGYPEDAILIEAKEIFDRALADSKE